MITDKNFKKAPHFDKKKILELMDKLTGKEMVQVVLFIQQKVENLDIADVIKSGFCECEFPLLVAGDSQLEDFCGKCYKDLKQKTVL